MGSRLAVHQADDFLSREEILPPEIMLLIFSLLPGKDVLTSAGTAPSHPHPPSSSSLYVSSASHPPSSPIRAWWTPALASKYFYSLTLDEQLWYVLVCLYILCGADVRLLLLGRGTWTTSRCSSFCSRMRGRRRRTTRPPI
jgi:hypothetical protein